MEDYDHSQALMVLMRRVLKQHRRNVDTLIQQYDVFPGQPPILLRLAKTDGLIQKDLAEHILIKPASLTTMLTRMEKSGMVTRQTDSQDQRISRVFLTEKGHRAALAVKEVMRDLEKKCFENFSDEEKELFKSMLLKIQIEMEDYNRESLSTEIENERYDILHESDNKGT
ncbi:MULTISPECIES: MarR family transcriptional regulator [Brevibacillus]|uniref:MarR family winged helix-turn-helix transcriptional regulator n=1 Tax=Brevibacillus TaxID=55080 RepID=UPI002040DF10|nr:MarR family transcriptional regulator [Brevibacillus sp. AY1]MCM3081388.1 MarR family transcriptional regulator [Brevibacillus invocatus]MCM3431764.1 MarR family transcriptional regulator [Brevibacillus invocatus]